MTTAPARPTTGRAPRAVPAGLAAATPAELASSLRYDRGRLTPAIVHLGVGGFHRAHQAAYLDDLLAAGATDWGIVGVGVLPSDGAMADALHAQDCLYTLVTKADEGTWQARIVGSIIDYLLAPADPGAVLARLAAPTTRIVSLTITEGGYNIDRTTGQFITTNAAVVADADRQLPETAFGFIVRALAHRRTAGQPPFTVMSCDNLPGNGDVARRAVVGFAALSDPGLAAWIEREVDFPNSMVDRITPVTTAADRAEIAARFGIDDAWPVVCEPYRAWVIEDRFALGRPPYEQAGALIVDDVAPYELMKLRLLNGSHQALAYFGRLLGYTYAHEAATDAELRDVVRSYMTREARPTLPEVPGVDLPAYGDDLLTRFANPAIGDTIARLAEWTTDRIPTWIVPIVRANLRSGRDITCCAAIIASWARYCEGTDEQGRPIEVVDHRRDERMAAARAWRGDPLSFVRNRQLFSDIAESARFAAAYTHCLDTLHEQGTRALLSELASATTDV